MIGDFVTVAEKTLQTGKIDGGATVLFAPESLTVVAGGHDGRRRNARICAEEVGRDGQRSYSET